MEKLVSNNVNIRRPPENLVFFCVGIFYLSKTRRSVSHSVHGFITKTAASQEVFDLNYNSHFRVVSDFDSLGGHM